MLEALFREAYNRKEVRRVLHISEARLRSWEKQGLVPCQDSFGFSDLLALRTLQELRKARVPASQIRRAMAAIRDKLACAGNPLTELKLFSQGRKVAVVVDGHKMEPVSGQLLLDFDAQEFSRLVSFPRNKAQPSGTTRESQADYWFQKGLELEQTGAPVRNIIEAYQRAVSLDPHSAGALVNLGTAHYHLRSWKEAEAYYKQALEADPSYALAHFNLGNLYDEIGNPALAQHHYEAALQLHPNYADAHYNLALLSQGLGNVMKAVRHWRIYLKLDPAGAWAVIARRELDKLRKATLVPGSALSEDARTREDA